MYLQTGVPRITIPLRHEEVLKAVREVLPAPTTPGLLLLIAAVLLPQAQEVPIHQDLLPLHRAPPDPHRVLHQEQDGSIGIGIKEIHSVLE